MHGILRSLTCFGPVLRFTWKQVIFKQMVGFYKTLVTSWVTTFIFIVIVYSFSCIFHSINSEVLYLTRILRLNESQHAHLRLVCISVCISVQCAFQFGFTIIVLKIPEVVAGPKIPNNDFTIHLVNTFNGHQMSKVSNVRETLTRCKWDILPKFKSEVWCLDPHDLFQRS